jgi:hypothetical protein
LWLGATGSLQHSFPVALRFSYYQILSAHRLNGTSYRRARHGSGQIVVIEYALVQIVRTDNLIGPTND